MTRERAWYRGPIGRPASAFAAVALFVLAGCVPDDPGPGGTATTITTTTPPTTTTTTTPPGSPTRHFLQRTDVSTATPVRDVRAGDLDGDGRKDLVGISGSNPTSLVSVVLADASGGFGPRVDYAAGGIIMSVELADTDNDGDMDVVAANGANGTVSVLRGAGNGTFGAPVVSTVGGTVGQFSTSSTIALGELDADAFIDAVVIDSGTSSRLLVLHGVGDGTFTATSLASALPRTRSVTLGDMDGDDHLDVVSVSDNGPVGSGVISVNLGVGDATFGSREDQAIPTTSLETKTGDFNGDGHLDVVAAPYFTADFPASAFTFAGNGTATLGAMVRSPRLIEGMLESVDLADMNGDGRADLIGIDGSRYELSVSLALPAGGFDDPAAYVTPNSAASIRRTLDLADMNGDGRVDIVWSDGRQNRASIYMAQANGRLAAMGRLNPGSGPQVLVGDATGDGNVDLLTINGSNPGLFRVSAGRGDGSFRPPVTHPTGRSPYGVALGDVSGDGIVDVVTADRADNTASVSLGTGAGAFAAPQPFAVGATPNGVVLADVSGDTKPDIVTVGTGAGGVSVLVGNGTGGFAAATNIATGASPHSVVARDLDGDTDVDLAVTNSASNNVAVLLNSGGGAFAPPVDYATGAGSRMVGVADMNGDSDLDLIVTGWSDAVLSTLLGNGDGTFQPRVNTSTVAKVSQFGLADFDGDGRVDASIGTDDTVVMPGAGFMAGNGSGGFAPPVNYFVFNGGHQFQMAAGDLNGDGHPDFVYTENASLQWLLSS